MCYSAQIVADYRKYVRMFGAHMSIREFAQLYWERAEGSNARIPKAMDAAFSVPQTDEERRIKEAIDRFTRDQVPKLEQELFKQRARLADAERTPFRAKRRRRPPKANGSQPTRSSRRCAGSTISGAPN
jgi:hypothetical protein